MTTKRRPTTSEYDALAKSYVAEPPRADESISIEANPAVLRTGRPAGRTAAEGKTPALPVRLPTSIRDELTNRVRLGETTSASELVRRALVEYFERHPAENG